MCVTGALYHSCPFASVNILSPLTGGHINICKNVTLRVDKIKHIHPLIENELAFLSGLVV